MRSDESLVPKGDKKAMQRVMPFLQFVAAEVRTQQERRITHRTRAHRGAGAGQVKLRGEEAMALEMPFDEVAGLSEGNGLERPSRIPGIRIHHQVTALEPMLLNLQLIASWEARGERFESGCRSTRSTFSANPISLTRRCGMPWRALLPTRA